jgi:TPP-dependent pyruvate/acetoin dehydrogenase alpha subunit
MKANIALHDLAEMYTRMLLIRAFEDAARDLQARA